MQASARAAAPELLERDDELELLAARIVAAVGGEGSVVALEGEAGIGKSALLAYAVRHASAAGMRVLSARAGELEQDFGYGVVRQLFESLMAAAAPAERERALSGAAGRAAPVLSAGPALNCARAVDPASVLHGLFWLSANLAAERPLLVAVDDAHWADTASIAFLSYLARRVEGLPLLVLYATRVGEGASERLPATADPGLVGTVLHPSVLGQAATVELIARRLGRDSSEEFAAACHAATAGNPFLLEELLRVLQADGVAPAKESCERVALTAPRAIRRAVIYRLGRLGHTATKLAFATAVLGKSAELRHAAGLAQLDPQGAADAVDLLARAAILRAGRPLEFIHPIVRTTIYAEIPAARRSATHKRAASLLERDGVGVAEIAPHLMASEAAGDRDVVRRLRRAADHVRDRGAPEAACEYLARALAEPPPPEDRAAVMYELGSAELSAGRPAAAGHLRKALESDLDPQLQIAAAQDFALALVVTDRVEAGIELLDASSARIAAAGDVESAMQLEGTLLCLAQLSPTTSKLVRSRLAPYEGRLRGATLGERLLLAAMAFDAAHRRVPAAYAAGLAELALADGQLLREQPEHAANYALAGWTMLYTDRFEDIEHLATLAVAQARERGSLIAYAIATGSRCQVRLRHGRLADAEAEARSCLEATGHAWVIGRPMLIACVLDAMVERADVKACRAFLAEQRIDEDLASTSMATRLLYSRGHMRLAAGDCAAALGDFEQILGREARSGLRTAAVPTRASAALAHAQLGEHRRARELARDELALARVWGTPSALSFALRTAGIVTGGEEGIELLRSAAAAVEHSPARVERARSLIEFGAAPRRPSP